MPVALAAPSAAALKPPATPGKPDPKLIESIFACLSPGLPQDWKKAWIVVTELGTEGKEHKFEAKFFFSSTLEDRGEELTPCDRREIVNRLYGLNDLLAPEKRRWSQARLLITSEGDVELKYDYPK